jgi:phosphoesterase RecJ-like protein
MKEYHTAYIAINAEDLQRFKTRTGDTEGLVNYALSLEGAVFGVLISEREDGIRLSLRSKGNFSVNEFARKHFDGGGHKNAAGGTSEIPFEDTVIKFEKILEEYKSELNKQADAYKI